ncbi:MAG: hypothetical protein DRQ02_12290 [Candidatus Latescibacterota bacterium]|nr:MAG: hypothetical protein DRQ02_12290 [Candidatus Latescibacterota bacterium]
MVQILFFAWLKPLSMALVFKGIQNPLANQMSKKVVTFRERLSMYALALGYLSSGRASRSSLKLCAPVSRYVPDIQPKSKLKLLSPSLSSVDTSFISTSGRGGP